MANPIFANNGSFNGKGAPQQYGQAGPQFDVPQQGYAQRNITQQGYDQYQQQPTYAPQVGGVMTLDDVIAKTAVTLLVVFAAAAATFVLMPLQWLGASLIVSALVGFVTVMFVARRAAVPVGGVFFYALVEGVFVGAFSKFMEAMFPGIVFAAVLATFIAAGATLAAYKFGNIRVSPKFRKFVVIGTMAMAGLFLVNLIFAIFNVNLGIVQVGSGASWLAIVISILAVGLAVFNLILDFDFVERGIASRAPAQESWRAALGITVTMVWLYVEILRILSYFRN